MWELTSLLRYARTYFNQGCWGLKWFHDSIKTKGREGEPWMEAVNPPSDELCTAPRGGKFTVSLTADYFCLVLFLLEEREM